VQLLLERGAAVNARGSEGNIPLHGVAVMPVMDQRLIDGSLKFPPAIPGTILAIVRLLLEHGADPSVSNNDGVSPLSLASAETRAEMEAFARRRG
jgi:ankyrin repeat protein